MDVWTIAGIVLLGVIVLGLMSRTPEEPEAPPVPSDDLRRTTVGDDWQEFYAFYRSIGFFIGISGELRSSDAAYKVRAASRRAWHREVAIGEPDVAWMVLALDADRVWWSDPKLEVGPGMETYRDAVRAWAHISRGALDVDFPVETWEGLMGPVRVTFLHEGEKVMLMPEVRDRFLDLGVLARLNALISQEGYTFQALHTGDGTVCLVVLTDAERQAMERRGVRFDDMEFLLGNTLSFDS